MNTDTNSARVIAFYLPQFHPVPENDEWWGKGFTERPLNEVLASGEPDFPFCLAWANESWRGYYHGIKSKKTLIDQLYPGKEDYVAHFNEVLPAFRDKRYITVDGKPLFIIYHPFDNQSEVNVFMNLWRKLTVQNGLEGIYRAARRWHKWFGFPWIVSYKKGSRFFVADEDSDENRKLS